MFCMGFGLVEPSGNCSEGWYCSGGAITPNSTMDGNQCPVGYYCPEGSASPTPCTPGLYCGISRLSLPQGLCTPGYFCINASSTATPTNGIEGSPCIPGHFCIEGSSSPEPCPPGTFTNSSFNQNISDCFSCPGGYYCSEYGLTAPNGPCSAGFYCPADQFQASPSPSAFECPEGHFCIEGSFAPQRCPSGMYQPNSGSADCNLCPPGYFCDNSFSVVVLNSSTICPEGFYCPAGTQNAFSFPCPVGTYSNQTGLHNETQCTLCEGGMQCSSNRLIQPIGLCNAGYYCRYGSKSSTPMQGVEADVCPPGRYCTAGTVEPFLCPLGTFSNVSGLTSDSQCTNCISGYYCDMPGITDPSGLCSAGYHCPSNSISSTEIICTAGSYCPEGSQQPYPCPEGTYSNETELKSSVECLPCTSGKYCSGTGLAVPSGLCSEGYYCPTGTSEPQPIMFVCPIGSFCETGSALPTECPDGTYTSVNQSTECVQCPSGFYCTGGILVDMCPEGYYCPEGTGQDWLPCPRGTLSDQLGLMNASQCTLCPAGRYCNQLNAINYTGDCSPGYFCTVGVDTPTPSGYNTSDSLLVNGNEICLFVGQLGIGGVCPVGHYCPSSTAIPIPCPAGYYADQTRLSDCLPCPAGYFCLIGTTDFIENPCREGYYCPNVTTFPTEYPCPAGTFSNATHLQSVDDCTPCLPGQYCSGEERTSTSGLCFAGYYCTEGSPDPAPMVTTVYGGPCEPRYYCSEGSPAPIACDPGMYCGGNSLASPEGSCNSGYYCIRGAMSSEPVDGITGDVCPRGHYCPENSSTPSTCEPGTYSNLQGSQEIGDCEPCPAGLYCEGYALFLPTGNCLDGYYCPGGQQTPTPIEYICPLGHFCEAGDSSPQQCLSGSYQDEVGQSMCKVCSPGYYCDSSNGSVLSLSEFVCPPGFYCPEGTRFAQEFACPLGTWSNGVGLTNETQCMLCPATYYCDQTGLTAPAGLCDGGFYCVSGVSTPVPRVGPDTGDECPPGHYCPVGTEVPIACPIGTFSSQLRLSNVTQCTPCYAGHFCGSTGEVSTSGMCVQGYYCPEGSVSNTSISCPAGYYCPAGTPFPQPCPVGTYSSTTGLHSVDQCLLCTPGYFCEGLALTEPTGICDNGFHCPAGSPTARPFNFSCPVGHFCPENSSEPILCPEGTYNNQSHSSECFICPPGFYCVQGLLVARCSPGFFCPEGTGLDWISCPRGTYSNQFGLSTITDCTPCDGGMYCSELNATTPTGNCDTGYFCETGNFRSDPNLTIKNNSISDICNTTNAVGGICPVGHYCPEGSSQPLPCEAGTYANTTNLAVCLQCPPGYFCHVGSVSFEESICPQGYYCPPGTAYATENPCPVGTYSDRPGLTASIECKLCPAGYFCDSTNLTAPTGLCMEGWFCTGGAATSTASSSSEGGICEQGFFCPEGSPFPSLCSGGSFCDRRGLPAPTGLCVAGYYCRLGSKLATPMGNDSIGDICPEGHYCLAGSSFPEPCPTGTFLPVEGGLSSTECMSCTAGMFCTGNGLQQATGNCSAGYYCPGGQNSSTPSEYICPEGHFCPPGSIQPQRCASGFFQDEVGQDTCKICPAGFFCDNTIEPVVLFNSSICPKGFVCPNGTQYNTRFPCNIGTFGNITGLSNLEDCTPCTGGMYCDVPGLSEPQGLCEAGYFCMSGATSATPIDEPNANICPAGSFCPPGSESPIGCPAGTFSSSTGLGNVSQCSPCIAGYFCQDIGLILSQGECTESWFCPEGSSSPNQVECPAGLFCPRGSSFPEPCPIGTYSNTTHLGDSSECVPCTPGYFCNATGSVEPNGLCEAGFYCPSGTNSSRPSAYECPIGFYCPEGTGIPLRCNSTTFTDTEQQSECNICPAGWYCDGGNLIDLCAIGYYCPEGTSFDWQPCPVGTFSNVSGLSTIEECSPCPPHYYCNETAATEPSGLCDAGHFCTLANFVSNPVNDTAKISSCLANNFIGAICPVGHFCPLGSATPIACSAGTYSSTEGLSECLVCPLGYYCIEGSSDFSSQICPPGHYCPDGTMFDTQFQCPIGTFSNVSGLTNESQCETCSAGQYCNGTALTSPVGYCSAGWYCTGGANTPTPELEGEGGSFCSEGFFCPEGSVAPIPCTNGSYCDRPFLESPSGPCAAGYYCRIGSKVPTPIGNDSIGDICPAGHYCPLESSFPLPCPPGTYSNVIGNIDYQNCSMCPAGMFCEENGGIAPTGNCSAGYYCPGGQDIATPIGLLCPAGHFCSAASFEPCLCPPGTYQNQTGQTRCLVCPEGYVCDSTIEPIVTLDGRLCSPGSYCPSGTQYELQYTCPPGTYSNQSGLTSPEDCSSCDAGMFCAVHGLTSPSGPCYEGYYCQQGARSSTPDQPPLASICPAGFYCPSGSVDPTPCSIGTFNPQTGQSELTSCRNCTGGFYCNASALAEESGECEAGYFCDSGAENPTWQLCPDGHFCIKESAQPLPCPLGTFSPTAGLTNESMCINCWAGSYCNDTGLNSVSGPCDPGFYCPEGTSVRNPPEYNCNVGFHCPEGSSEQLACPGGYFTNVTTQSTCMVCPPGLFCLPVNEENITMAYQVCPSGYYCPKGTGIDWQPCPVGTFSNHAGLFDEDQCMPCTGGQYCSKLYATQPTGFCNPGFFCISGATRPDPLGNNSSYAAFSNDSISLGSGLIECSDTFQTIAGQCPVGHFCPIGTIFPVPCPNGMYTNTEGNYECCECPSGYFCPEGTSDFFLNLCPRGHYCSVGTSYDIQFPCPAGTYNPHLQSSNQTDCIPCDSGMSCPQSGLSTPYGICSPGWYCSGGSESPQPTDPAQGGPCLPGFYCPEGSFSPTMCDPGFYCSSSELANVTGPCNAGYFCIEGSDVLDPIDGVVGNTCPAGHYCEQQSTSPTPCPVGTYLNTTGNFMESQCRSCISGMYCENVGIAEPDGFCENGYYCPGGQNTSMPNEFLCDTGHFCPVGSPQQIRCDSGTYQDEIGMSDCKTCPAGFFCDSDTNPVTNLDGKLCSQGYYCPNGTMYSTQFPCPIGTYSNKTGLQSVVDCLPCSGGFYCPLLASRMPFGPCLSGYYCHEGAMSSIPEEGPDANICPPGSYCPEQSTTPLPCPIGTFSNVSGLQAQAECTNCTAGYACLVVGLTEPDVQCNERFYCPSGSSSSNELSCFEGHYCLPGSAFPTPCPAGTFSSTTHNSNDSFCLPCSSGSYCEEPGLSQPMGNCSEGFYCPGSQTSFQPAEFICPVGLHCPAGSSSPVQCVSGMYTNTSGSSVCEPCPAGYFCLPVLENNSTLAYALCPEGYFCPEGTGLNWQPCPLGTYSNVTGLHRPDQCLECNGGMYCSEPAATAPSGECYEGFFCTSGVDRPNPIPDFFLPVDIEQMNVTTNSSNPESQCSMPDFLGNHTGVGGICPTGHFCPSGTIVPLSCPAGMYNNITGQSECQDCPPSFYCPVNTSDFSSFECPPGYYCPLGTPNQYSFPCRQGTFNNLSRQRNESSCLACSPGMYCEGEGLSGPTGFCDSGWYCIEGSTSQQTNNTNEGGQCNKGSFCPFGSSRPIPCTLGSYCQQVGLESPTGLCSAGYYCNGSATVSNPETPLQSGGPCPEGHYCPQGSAIPTPCPPGTFRNATLGINISDCIDCIKGYHCDEYGLDAPSGVCQKGYYCPPGQTSSTPSTFICPIGFFCPTRSHQPLRCESGSYQNATGQSECWNCPAGFYCDHSNSSLQNLDPQLCPEGHYCLEGTRYANQYPCPVGTFNNQSGSDQASDCQPCLGGFYCPMLGIVTPTELCSPGYFCRIGAQTSTPEQENEADVCPAGYYCPLGTEQPLPCLAGSFSNQTILTEASQCQPCTAGYFCDTNAQTDTSGTCQSGYYCPEGAFSAFDVPCPAGYYCPTGSANPLACPSGTFSSVEFLSSDSECLNCTNGMFCNTSGITSPSGLCNEGYFCPEGTASGSPSEHFCPIGYFCPEGSSVPQLCPSGWFTNVTHSLNCTICPAAFYCTPELLLGTSTTYAACPRGFYCPEGTGIDLMPCPAGTYSNQTGLSGSSECTSCDGGMYCGSINATEVSGPCIAGYFCTSGNARPAPFPNDSIACSNVTSDDVVPIGGICPIGNYCPEGSPLPVPCPSGTFSNETGLGACFTCPSGYYCLVETSDFSMFPCPIGHYCPSGTTHEFEYPCPVGTFNNYTISHSIASCVDCPAGQFCDSPGLSEPSGLCREGWYCIGGATLATPVNSSHGDICPVGNYCPSGSPMIIPCDDGMFCSMPGLAAPEGNCSGGYYCPAGSVSQTPNEHICPTGHYCPPGSSSPLSCPAGTYINSTGNVDKGDCMECALGMYCLLNGLSEPSGACSPGYFCPGGQISATPSNFSCPEGHFCLSGSFEPQPCPPGTFQDAPVQSECLPCPPGYYCDPAENGDSPITSFLSFVCPEGSYCLEGTEYANQYQCPLGTFSNSTGLEMESDCQSCLGGYYCGERGLIFPNMMCSAGYFCLAGADRAAPMLEGFADVCPPGSYCPEGTVDPINCPIGTFSNESELHSEMECTPCTAGFFCDTPGITEPSGPCNAGYVCEGYAENAFWEVCPAGNFCPKQSEKPEPCPSGTFSNATGLTADSECTSCIPGSYCLTVGLVEPSGYCSEGYYCPEGSITATEYVCPGGLYCPEGRALPLECPDGSYTDQAVAAECSMCPEGFFCLTAQADYDFIPVTVVNASSNVMLCPAGYYCPAGTGIDWKSCPIGTYSNTLGLYTYEQCTLCDPGMFCDAPNLVEPSGSCFGGYYCSYGNYLPNPSNVSQNILAVNQNNTECRQLESVGDICPRGTYCPNGTSTPLQCEEGTYNDLQGETSCRLCPEGFLCPPGTDYFTFNECPTGYVCPEGTEHQYQYPCPAGSYNPYTGQQNYSECLPCPGGLYCEASGLSNATGPCAEGYYCIQGNTSPRPLDTPPSVGGICPVGSYCPEMSVLPTECDPGMYCGMEGLPQTQGPCDAGYFCLGGAHTASPSDNVTGNICPQGSYCVQGSTNHQPCPPGHLLNYFGASNFSECQLCSSGYYCSQYRLSNPDGECSEGFYCPEGQVTPTPVQFICSEGYFCPNQSSLPQPCPAGTYQDEVMQAECKACPAGYYCSNATGPVINFEMYNCPQGYYCPEGTRYSTEFPCPLGTFSNLTGLNSSSFCNPCTAGDVCDENGLSGPSNVCGAGYFCVSGASQTAPVEGPTTGICTVGHYCPPGTDIPMPCLPGTFSNYTGLSTPEQCSPCTTGSYCIEHGLVEPTGPCMEGYYCPLGAINSTDTLCPPSYYCVHGSSSPSPCPVGTYSSLSGLVSTSECSQCPAGQYCETPGSTNPTGMCEAGYYCPEGSYSRFDTICPAGFFCPEGSPIFSQCQAGTYTNTTGSSECSLCEDGFYCLPVSIENATDNHLLCPPGYYCPEGTGSGWKPCPMGTYRNESGLQRALQCTPCDSGMYCDELGAIQPTGPCNEGYFCSIGIPTPEPQNVSECSDSIMSSSGFDLSDVTEFSVFGGVCPVGHFCLVGSDIPSPCPAGTYNDHPQQSNCSVCPEGFFCLTGSITYLNTLCPDGHYCPEGSQFPELCPIGTFNNVFRASSETDCLACTPGMYCEDRGLTEPTGLCSEGWYCSGGSFEAMPSMPHGGICNMSEYCPLGSSFPTPCTGGYACTSQGLSNPDVECEARYFCPEGSSTPQVVVCPPGYYCPAGSVSPLPCPVGTYSDQIGIANQSECIQCTPGYFCNSTSLIEPSGLCDERYYCLSGQSTARPSNFICPQGHFCLEGSEAPIRCEAGSYQDELGQIECKTCPSSFYCDNRFTPVVLYNDSLCPAGHYCPDRTSFATDYPCPPGTYSNVTGLDSVDQCTSCTEGQFCEEYGLTEPNGLCYAGYICLSGSDTPVPENMTCPEGHYCPEGTVSPIPCPMGTYSAKTLNTREDDCQLCGPGRYCTGEGAINATNMPCFEGYICIQGASIPTPNDNITGYICPAGHFCTNGSLIEEKCPRGTYQPDIGQASCISCPTGAVCPRSGLINFIVCPEGFYCPNEMMNSGIPCPVGTFSNMTGVINESSCQPCPAGEYCATQGLFQPSGSCDAGFLCLSSATSPAPNDGLNFPCPTGFYCTEGTNSPSPCPVGTMASYTFITQTLNGDINITSALLQCFREPSQDSSLTIIPDTGLTSEEECLPCVGGFYCQHLNSTGPTGPCSAGYYCPHNATIVQPTPDEYRCFVGHYCPMASVYPIVCPAGTYTNVTGSEECNICPAGHYCPIGAIDPIVCSPRFYCPSASPEPVFCPNGTYATDSAFGLVSEDQCTPCIRGYFCIAGEIAGECSAGYICYQGSGVPNPDGSDPSIGEPCPEGFYCLQGALNYTACPEGLFNVHRGGRQQEDCTLCPPGRVCTTGSQFAELCPAGHYCLNGTGIPCPPGTYSTTFGASDSSFCLPCEPGYLCPDRATISFIQNPCPVGHYCESGLTDPINCPAGTHRNETAGMNVSDCYLCPAGFYCPENATIHGIPCNVTETCPEGTITPSPCSPGFYCPEPGIRLSCPEGYYCPMGSSTFIECPRDHYCERPPCTQAFINNAGAHAPTVCSLGYREIFNTGENFTRESFDTTCEPCPAGTYSNASSTSETDRTCYPCPDGYYCTGRSILGDPDMTPVLNAFVCPTGHHCPTGEIFGSSFPIACPVGTFNALNGSSNETECLPCPADTFSHLEGQEGCFDCPTGSNSESGAEGCVCVGDNRVFQVHDNNVYDVMIVTMMLPLPNM